MIADQKFKQSVNELGGWYDEQGQWIEANGHYDEDGNWVANEGYIDEATGRFIRYAKVTGDLSFMV